MDEQTAQQLGIGLVCVVIGLSGWLLPYRWNILRFRRFLRALLPEKANQLAPKILGTVLIIAGIVILIATALGGRGE
jgi:uncharacterized protein YjeT (DUF2065 family)